MEKHSDYPVFDYQSTGGYCGVVLPAPGDEALTGLMYAPIGYDSHPNAAPNDPQAEIGE